ncbi:MAG: hypothetical protein SGARI_007623 [Bacillariaceae sp.]
MEGDEYDSDGEEIQEKVFGSDTAEIISGSYAEKMSLFSKLTMCNLLTKLKLFKILQEPRKLFSVEDAQGLRPFS